MKAPILYWFRNDLRLDDNIALFHAIQTGHPIIFLYLFESSHFEKNHLGFERLGSFRYQHLQNSLHRLRQDLGRLGSELHILKGNARTILPDLAGKFNCTSIYAHHEYAHEELETEKAIGRETELKLFWGNMVYPPSQVPFQAEESPFYYTRFMKKVQALTPHPPIEAPESIVACDVHLDHHNIEAHETPDDPRVLMEQFIHSPHLDNYHITREYFEGEHYSSFLSPFLADGSLSARLLYHRLQKLSEQKPGIEPSITKLKQQLIWRDYYRFLFLRYGHRIFTKHGLRKKNRERFDDLQTFENWKNGLTPSPLINAFMSELKYTGFLSNRGRMLCSYYLSKELQVNWLWGAAWFEHILVDYDICNNYGNWAYQSGVGTDSRFNRRFNLDLQSRKFDPEGRYLQRWNNR